MVNSDNLPFPPTPTPDASPGTPSVRLDRSISDPLELTDPRLPVEAAPSGLGIPDGQLQMADPGMDATDVPVPPSDYSDDSNVHDDSMDDLYEQREVTATPRGRERRRTHGRSVRRARAALQPWDSSGRFLPRTVSAPPRLRSPATDSVELEGVPNIAEGVEHGSPAAPEVEQGSLSDREVEHGSLAEARVEHGSLQDDGAERAATPVTELTYTDAGHGDRNDPVANETDEYPESGYASYADLTLQDGPAPPVQADEEGWYTELSIAEAREGQWLTPLRVARWREDVTPDTERATGALNRFTLLTIDPMPDADDEQSSGPRTPLNRFPPVLPQITPVSAEFAAEFRDYESSDDEESASDSPESTDGYAAEPSSEGDDTYVASPPLTPSSDYRGERVATPEVIARTGITVHSATVTVEPVQTETERGGQLPQDSPVKNERMTPVPPGSGGRGSLPPTVGMPLFGPPWDPSQYQRREPSDLNAQIACREYQQLGQRAFTETRNLRESLCPFYNWEAEDVVESRPSRRAGTGRKARRPNLRSRSRARASRLAHLIRMLAAEVAEEMEGAETEDTEAGVVDLVVELDLEAVVPAAQAAVLEASQAVQDHLVDPEAAMGVAPETGVEADTAAEEPAVLLHLLRLFLGLLQQLLALTLAILGAM
ncbi:hypothetical protein AURDEDRAFT_131373 [Auricularia subglabra TFB-10046 SS5]|uniref:Uncharacterized protein n=1 Tax=Auricularia subglabra (strain TFB-10046 / SS5) TaxID=717982 RepID=J0D5J4_AURST|nr:hypothetical protein AURDEDRAFT_131373 [Auricularia subglabra TFB-10046 SS5]